MPSQPPRVLISYSHDSAEHARRVLGLAERLRKDGVDVQLDQYVTGTPTRGWPRWMNDQLDSAEFVLVVCTETYRRRFLGREEPDKGKGADWEGSLITLELYDARSDTNKFVPVLFDGQDESFIPRPLSGHTRYLLSSEDNYAKLYDFLTGQAGVVPGTLGPFKTRAREAVEPLRFDVSDMPARQLPLSNLPERNLFFTGRKDVLAQLEEALATQGRAALSGLGGVGKTQTALEYAHRHEKEYDYIFWTSANSREAIISGYATLAGLLKLPEAGAQEQTIAVKAIKRWLGSHESWLLLLDNADDLGMAREFIPPGNNGHVLLTTRAGATGAVARRLDIEEMGSEEGALFLLRRSKYIAEHAPLEAASEGDHSTAEKITTQLDGLPLALDQAGAYIEETRCGLSGYLDLYRSHALELLRLRGGLPSDHPDPVATTWALSFENIEKTNRPAAELLRCCAFLDPDAIPEELFREGATELGPVLGVVASDILTWNDALSEILKYSLLRRDPNASTLEIHRLVQAVLKQAMDEATKRLWAKRVVRAINLAFPNVEFSTWPLCERLLPQAHASAKLINQWNFEYPEDAQLLYEAGVYLFERGRYSDAKPLYELALTIREKAQGPEHPDVAQSLNDLGRLYRAQGQYEEAKRLLKRALAIREKAGPEHLDVAQSLLNLAAIYRTLGQYKDAEPHFQRARAIREMALPSEHQDVAQSLNNLARLYGAMGQHEKAEPLYERALAIREKALSPEDPDVAWSLYGLAETYRALGQYEKAEPLLERALAIREKALPPEHRDIAWSLYGLAELCRAQGRYAKAEPLFERALVIRQKALGPEHPHMAWDLDALAALYDNQGQYEKAEHLYKRALAIREKALGPEHPNVATSLENYALLLRKMGRPEEAAPLESRARAIRAKSA